MSKQGNVIVASAGFILTVLSLLDRFVAGRRLWFDSWRGVWTPTLAAAFIGSFLVVLGILGLIRDS